MMLYQCTYHSFIGELTLVSNETHLLGLWIEGQAFFMGKLHGDIIKSDDLPVLFKTKAWLDDYFEGKQPDIHVVPRLLEGSEFQKMVWEELCLIPYGHTTTYQNIALKVAKKLGKQHMSAQAVGGAVAHNPISIIVPCHRVIGKNNKLVGYAGGIAIKAKLLDHERKNFTASE